MKKITIAIDGTAGSGKSTLAKSLAEKLGYLYIDTGAMYRALTYKAIVAGIDLKDSDELIELARRVKICLEKSNDSIKVLIDNEDVTDKIILPQVSDAVSLVAAIAGVRKYMVEHQRRMGQDGGVVLEGRDIGTVVFPDADIKLFLKAEVQERTKRRHKELADKGIKSQLTDVAKNLTYRDQKDSSRDVSPLKPAADAIIIDTTKLTMDQKNKLAWQYIETKI